MQKNNHDGKATIIILDDDEMPRSLLENSLKNEGYNVLTAENGFSLMSVLHKESPKAILLDVSTKWVSCPDLCLHMKNSERFKNIKLIFMSKDEEHHLKEKLGNVEYDGHIKKPYTLSYLLEKVKSHLNEEKNN